MNWHNLQRTIGYLFSDVSQLENALTHPSYAAETAVDTEHYERLEFLGDAVLQIVITDLIFLAYPAAPEGQMTKMRSLLTRESTLAEFGRSLDLGNHLRLGKGEAATGGKNRESLLCDSFEALLGAMYLDADSDLEPVRELMLELLGDSLMDLESKLAQANPKGALQEVTQMLFGKHPLYETIGVEGPDHERIFTVQVLIDKMVYGEGSGKKRQLAEEQAALAAINYLETDHGKEHNDETP